MLLSAKPAKSKEDDIEKTLSVILKHMEKYDGAIEDDSDDSRPEPKQAEEKANGESGESGRKGLRQRAKRKIKSVLGK
ncbi:hypothetical protein THAOC_13650 [Thalassiosira oceanica]|nr:hypothetical protein THAOC_13650 [Thalassiosira oceanica]|eukprot:EJK65481.1 hypothetical protein THAOC_13650 [Thalassiosira oceanica]